MSETLEEVAAEEKRETLFGSLSAKVLHALAPMIRETQDYSHSMEFFCSQTPDAYCATYLVPANPGAILAVCQPFRMLAVHDPSGYADRVMRVYFPDEMLDAVKPKTVTLRDENGCAFTVECEPRPGRVHVTDGFGSVFPFPEDMKKWEGAFGTWFNGDTPGVRDAASFRNEAASIPFVKTMLQANESGDLKTAVDVDLSKLAPMCHAAEALGLPVRITLLDGAVRLLSTDGGTLFGMLAPLPFKEEFDANAHVITNTLIDPPAKSPTPIKDAATPEASAERLLSA
jgi:hypothetical protein